jgi:hypothetical protein
MHPTYYFDVNWFYSLSPVISHHINKFFEFLIVSITWVISQHPQRFSIWKIKCTSGMIFVTFLKRRNLFNRWNCIKMSVKSLRRKRENFINKKLLCGMVRSVALESGDEMVFITGLVARHIFWNCRNEICPRVKKNCAYVNFLIFFPLSNGIYKRQIGWINICIFERWVTLLIQIWIIYFFSYMI